MITIESIKECFLNTFQLLSSKQQKIWRYVQWYAQRYRQVFPSHATIAEAVGCHRDTVIQAIKKFCHLGWLGTVKRCFRSSLYFIHDELINLDTNDSNTFKKHQDRVKPTEKPTLKPTENPTLFKTESYVMPVRNSSIEPQTVQHTQSKETKNMLENIGILGKDLWCLMRYSLRAVSLAIEDYKTRKAPEQIRNLPAWLTSRCKAYSLMTI